MSWSELLTLVIAAIAAVVTYINLRAFVKYSNISVYSNFQKLVLDKSKDCNALWRELDITAHFNQNSLEVNYAPTISEIIISLQLIDETLESLAPKKLQQTRNHFIKQFWIQLDTSLREFIKTSDANQFNSVFGLQLKDIQTTYGHLFKKY